MFEMVIVICEMAGECGEMIPPPFSTRLSCEAAVPTVTAWLMHSLSMSIGPDVYMMDLPYCRPLGTAI